MAENAPWTVESNVNDDAEWPCVSGVIKKSSNVGAVRTQAMDRTEVLERTKSGWSCKISPQGLDGGRRFLKEGNRSLLSGVV